MKGDIVGAFGVNEDAFADWAMSTGVKGDIVGALGVNEDAPEFNTPLVAGARKERLKGARVVAGVEVVSNV